MILAPGFLPQRVDGALNIQNVPVNVAPAKTNQFSRTEPRQNLKPVGIDIRIFHLFAAPHGSAFAEENCQFIGLQNLFANQTRTAGNREVLRDITRQLAFAAVFAEGPQIGRKILKRLAAASL